MVISAARPGIASFGACLGACLWLVAPPCARAEEPARGEGEERATDAEATEGASAVPPFRLDDLGTPDWLAVGGTHRSRYEFLSDAIAAGEAGSDQLIVLRTTLWGELRFDPVAVGLEVLDSRAYMSDANTLLTADLVNALEPLQAYVALDLDSRRGDRIQARAGRMTLDVGSERLAARNGYRNTINGFDGGDLRWTLPSGDLLRSFVVLPVVRRPSDPGELRDNRIQIDREYRSTIFWGLFHASRPWVGGLSTETYVFGLWEADQAGRSTRDRRLVTFGGRLQRAEERGAVDAELEAVGQLGRSSPSTDAGAANLSHRAYFLHAEVGYGLDIDRALRLAVGGDYASGDRDPDDDVQGRFDTLYGGHHSDFGPTDIYGVFARSNLASLVVRLEAEPLSRVSLMVAYRPAWLAQARDAWTTTEVRDPEGASGSFLGHQLQGELSYAAIEDTLSFEVGAAQLWFGEFPRTAPNAPDANSTTYVYLQADVQL